MAGDTATSQVGEAGGSTPVSSTIQINQGNDVSNPFYLHPSDSPGMVLVNSIFDGKSYGGWRRAVFIALSAKNKLSFIDGSLSEPAVSSPTYKAWNRCNDMVISWLLNSLSKDIAESVLYSKTAKDIWKELEDRFGQCNGAKLFQLQKELSDLVQGNSDVAGYYTKVKGFGMSWIVLTLVLIALVPVLVEVRIGLLNLIKTAGSFSSLWD